jgi:hypothetical protein
MEEKKKLEAIAKIIESKGGFFLLSYDAEGFCELTECIGDNDAVENGSALSELLADAQLKYINWRSGKAAK